MIQTDCQAKCDRASMNDSWAVFQPGHFLGRLLMRYKAWASSSSETLAKASLTLSEPSDACFTFSPTGNNRIQFPVTKTKTFSHFFRALLDGLPYVESATCFNRISAFALMTQDSRIPFAVPSMSPAPAQPIRLHRYTYEHKFIAFVWPNRSRISDTSLKKNRLGIRISWAIFIVTALLGHQMNLSFASFTRKWFYN